MAREFGAQGSDDVVNVQGRIFPSYSRSEIHPAISGLLKDMPKGKLLDFPAGTGSLSWRLQCEGFTVSAADIIPEAFKNPEIEIRKGNLNERFPYEDAQFDYACFVEGPEHVENVFHCLREFSRVLKPGGVLILSLPNYSNLQNRIKQLLTGVVEPVVSYESLKSDYVGNEFMIHINRLTYPMIRMALEFAGFKIESVHQDRPKKKQRILWPLAWFIQLYAALRGEKGQAKYWMKDNNASAVLMGGNTLILIARLKKQATK